MATGRKARKENPTFAMKRKMRQMGQMEIPIPTTIRELEHARRNLEQELLVARQAQERSFDQGTMAIIPHLRAAMLIVTKLEKVKLALWLLKTQAIRKTDRKPMTKLEVMLTKLELPTAKSSSHDVKLKMKPVVVLKRPMK